MQSISSSMKTAWSRAPMRVARWFSISRLEYSWRHVVGPCPSYGITSLHCWAISLAFLLRIHPDHFPRSPFCAQPKRDWDFKKTRCKVAGKSTSIYTNKCKKVFRRDLSYIFKPKRMFTLHEVMIWTHEWSINILIVGCNSGVLTGS